MWFVCALFFVASGEVLGTSTRFTNIKCEVFDSTYCTYKRCDLKIMGRGVVALNVHAKLLKGPFNNAKVNLSLWRKYNGFRPFMFNSTMDFCNYMANKQVKMSFDSLFFDVLRQASNVNHTCPYEDAIIVQNMVIKEEFFKFLPLPSGEYKVQLKASTDNDWKTVVSIYIQRTEDLMSN